MEIESQRLDFLTFTIHITKAPNILEHIREGREKKNQKNPGRRARPGLRVTPGSRATWAARDAWVARDPNRARRLGHAQPRSCATWAARRPG